jgi:hypothetical protein
MKAEKLTGPQADGWRNIAIALIDPGRGGFECNRLVTSTIPIRRLSGQFSLKVHFVAIYDVHRRWAAGGRLIWRFPQYSIRRSRIAYVSLPPLLEVFATPPASAVTVPSAAVDLQP